MSEDKEKNESYPYAIRIDKDTKAGIDLLKASGESITDDVRGFIEKVVIEKLLKLRGDLDKTN